MSFFKKIFGNDNESQEDPSFWKNLENEEDLKKIIEEQN